MSTQPQDDNSAFGIDAFGEISPGKWIAITHAEGARSCTLLRVVFMKTPTPKEYAGIVAAIAPSAKGRIAGASGVRLPFDRLDFPLRLR